MRGMSNVIGAGGWTPALGFAGGATILRVRGDGLVDAGGGTANAWTDTSGAGVYTPVQATGAKQPTIATSAALNGRKVARFTGTQFIDCGAAHAITGSALSVLIVFTSNVAPGAFSLLVGRQGANNQWGIVNNNATGWGAYFGDLGNTSDSRNIYDGTGRHLIGIWDGTNEYVRCAGRIISTLANAGPVNEPSDHVTIGAAWGSGSGANFSTADIAEVVIVRGALTQQDVTNWCAYCAAYYGIPQWLTKTQLVSNSIGVAYGVDGNFPTTWDGTQLAWLCQYMAAAGRTYGDPVQDAGNEHHGGAAGSARVLSFNMSYTGETLTQISALDMPQMRAFDTEFRNLVFLDGGSNDIGFGSGGTTTLAGLIANMQGCVTVARGKTNGSTAKLIAQTPIDRNWDNSGGQTIAQKQALWTSWCSYLRNPANWPTLGIDGVLDFAADARFGGNGAGTAFGNLTYYQADGIHPATGGHAAMGQIAALAAPSF